MLFRVKVANELLFIQIISINLQKFVVSSNYFQSKIIKSLNNNNNNNSTTKEIAINVNLKNLNDDFTCQNKHYDLDVLSTKISEKNIKLANNNRNVKIANNNDNEKSQKEIDFVPEWNKVVDLIQENNENKSIEEKNRKKKTKYDKNNSKRLETSLEPVYFEPFPPLELQHHLAHNNHYQQQQQQQPFEYYKNYLENQQNNNQLNSFYSIDNNDNNNKHPEEEDSLTPILLQSYENGEQNRLITNNNKNQIFPLNAFKQQQQQPKELDLRKFNFNTIKHAIENFNRSQDLNSNLPYESSQIQNKNLLKIDNKNNFKAQQNQLYQNFSLAKSKSTNSITNNNRKVQNYFKPSILNRPKQIVNLSSLLKPGEAILKEKQLISNDNDNDKVQFKNEKISTVNTKNINNLNNLLEPLRLRESEKPESEKIKLIEELDDLNDIDDDDENKNEKFQQLRKENKLKLILPTHHLFGGSLGIVNESLINNLDNDHDDDDGDGDGEKNNKSKVNRENEQQLLFLNTLAKLSSKLGINKPEETSRDLSLYLSSNNEDKNKINNNNDDDDDFFERNEYNKQVFNNNNNNNADNKQQEPSIPIDVLVDHLMSSSRVASFGLQHNQNDDDEKNYNNPDEEEEEEEDNEDDDKDNNGTLPIEAHGNINAYESKLNEIKVPFSSKQNNFNTIDFKSIQNKSDSWIPLDGIKLNSKDFKSIPVINNDNNNNTKMNKEILLKKRKRLKRHKSNNDKLNLIIGTKKLNRTDLIRLINVLNKMASQKRPSKQREASRKLLRFLIKLALEEYKKTKQKNDDLKLIRSVLEGPESVIDQDNNNNNNTVIELKTLGLIKREKNYNYDDDIEEKGKKNYKNNSLEGENLNDSRRVKKKSDDVGSGRLKEISDELENYFDSDFFEDMADKLNNKTTTINYDNGNNAADSTISKLSRKRSEKFRRIPYSLPVPIYGHQMIEAADEDDVELDHVRVPIIPRKRRLSNNNSNSLQKKFKQDKRRKRRGNRSYKHKNKQMDEQNEEEEEEQEQEEDYKDKDKDKDKRDDDYRGRDQRQKQSKLRKITRRPSAKKIQIKNLNQKLAKTTSQDIEDDNPNDAEPEEPEQNDKNDSDEKESQLYESNNNNDDNNNNNVGEKQNIRTSRRKKVKKINRNSLGKRKKSFKDQKKEIDSDSRYEIPPPIEKGKSIVTSNSKQINRMKLFDDSKSTGENEKLKFIPNTNKHNIKDRSLKRPNRVKKRLSSERFNKQMSDISDANDPKEPDDNDPDYYNEGTSYSKVCDDDGECKVTVESNSPSLSNAIKSGDKPTVERQLDKWANNGGD